jgi:hypothetical protein
MRFRVYLLRQRGRRIPWRDLKNGRTYLGTLTTCVFDKKGERYNAVEVVPADPMSADRPPPLYEPVLLGFAPLAFRLRGFERVDAPDGSYAAVQEWYCEEG